jgi:predicted DsbA family dithiol-disulfide isomerase
MERDVESSKYELLADKYGISVEEATARCRSMEQMASEAGLKFNFDTQIQTNTFDAHRLTMLAKSHDLMHEMTERILKAYYTEGKHIGDRKTLMELAEDVGLNKKEVEEILASDAMKDEVRADEQEASQLGIRSIPFFLINKKYAVSGAQSTEIFLQSMEQVYEQDGPFEGNND